GAALAPMLLRPFYQRAEEYQLLVTFGLLMILEDLLRFVWGPYPLSASEVFENFGSLTLGDSLYPTYNFLVIGVGIVAATFLWAFIYKTRFGVTRFPELELAVRYRIAALVLLIRPAGLFGRP